MILHITQLLQPLPYSRCTSRNERATASAVSDMQSGFNDPSEEDLEERLEDLRDTRIRLELQLPALTRVSSEEDLLSTDMSLSGSMEDIYGTPVPPASCDQGCKKTICEDSSMLFPGETVKWNI